MFDQSGLNIKSVPKNTIRENDFPIHSMESDLEKLKTQPNYDPSSFSGDQINKEKAENRVSLSEKQKTSPFLAGNPSPKEIPSSPIEASPDSAAIPIRTSLPSRKEELIQAKSEPLPAQIPLPPKKNSRASLLIFSAILFIGAIGFGIYYFLNTYQNENSDSSSEILPVSEAEPPTEPSQEIVPEPEKPILYEDKPNFLVLAPQKEMESINRYIEEVQKLPEKSLIEFVPTDEKYIPLKFSEFSEKLGLVFPAKVLEVIDNDSLFSLYAFQEKADVKLGISLKTKEPEKLHEAMREWEKTMTSDLKGIYFGKTFTETTEPFNENEYQGNKIRYKNFAPDASLSLDYLILKDQLMILTSKNFAWAIIDKTTEK
ncbi:MAG: hypothetical protein ACOYS2_01980 [Patescibacteria group bacterium]